MENELTEKRLKELRQRFAFMSDTNSRDASVAIDELLCLRAECETREMRVAEKVRDACSKQCLEALRDPGCDGDGFCHRVDSDSINSLYLAAIIKEVHTQMKNCPKHGKKFIKSRIVTDAHRLETDNDDDHYQ